MENIILGDCCPLYVTPPEEVLYKGTNKACFKNLTNCSTEEECDIANNMFLNKE